MKKTLAIVCSTLLLVSVGCEDPGAIKPPAPPSAETIEKMRDSAEEAVEDAVDGVKEAAEAVGDAVDRAGEAVGDAIDNATGGNN